MLRQWRVVSSCVLYCVCYRSYDIPACNIGDVLSLFFKNLFILIDYECCSSYFVDSCILILLRFDLLSFLSRSPRFIFSLRHENFSYCLYSSVDLSRSHAVAVVSSHLFLLFSILHSLSLSSVRFHITSVCPLLFTVLIRNRQLNWLSPLLK